MAERVRYYAKLYGMLMLATLIFMVPVIARDWATQAEAQEGGTVEDRLWTLEHRYDAFVQNTELEFKLHADTILRLQERLDDQERVIRRLCRKTDLAPSRCEL